MKTSVSPPPIGRLGEFYKVRTWIHIMEVLMNLNPTVVRFPHRDVLALLSLLHLFPVFLFLLVEVQDVLDCGRTRPDLRAAPVARVT